MKPGCARGGDAHMLRGIRPIDRYMQTAHRCVLLAAACGGTCGGLVVYRATADWQGPGLTPKPLRGSMMGAHLWCAT
jgi:hypothetical protein